TVLIPIIPIAVQHSREMSQGQGQGGSDGEDGRWLRRNKRSNRGRVKARRTAPPTVMSESGQGHSLRCRSIQLSLTEYSQSKHRVRSGCCCPRPRRLLCTRKG